MKFNHNKKRNTAFIYEGLVKELSKIALYEDTNKDKKNQVLSILREFFSKGKTLKKELDIYKSFDKLDGMDEKIVEKLIAEARKQHSKMDKKEVFNAQTSLINKINKTIGPKFWNNFLTEFKKIATVNQVIFKDSPPRKQVLLEKKLIESLTKRKEEKKPFPNVNNLAIKAFVKKFNDEYSETLQENQKTLLNKYITSYQDDGIELKVYLYEEIDRLKQKLNEHIKMNKLPESNKIQKIADRINNYNKRKLDKDFISEIMKLQSLESEFDKNDP
jgi:hypothetical protein